MPKAIWNGKIIAEAPTEATETVEGNVYFPHDALKAEYFQDSQTTSKCPWKGMVNYYTVTVDGKTNTDAAWSYRTPLQAAQQIQNHVAFWKGVIVEA